MHSNRHLLALIKGLIISLLLLFSFHGFCQLSRGGSPLSVRYALSLTQLPVTFVSPPNLTLVNEEDNARPVPYRFAINLPVANGEGVWMDLPGGEKAWFLAIEAPGALALTLYFDEFFLPPGGRLYVYNEERTTILGAFTEMNHSNAGTFATALVPGDRLIVEYNGMTSGEEIPRIQLSEIAYAYRGVQAIQSESGFGSSGLCEVNVNCPEGENWQTRKLGVMRVGVKKGVGTYWCTGSLVNNTRLDYTPYVLTADHCGNGATTLDISKWLFYFDFESTGCSNPPVSPSWWSLSGASLIASSGDVNAKGSDFFLVLLNDFIPDTVDTWFNGWDRNNSASPFGVSIHHPQGDIKKISTYTSPAISSYWGISSEETHWEVIWSATLSGHGVTEPGSSGSPLFDPAGRIVGTLTGGGAACDSLSLELPDYYGKFFWSWDMNGSTPGERLDCWLDPDNTGAEILNGLPLNIYSQELVENGLTLFPNPTSGILCLKANRLAGQITRVTFTDSRGLIVWEEELNACETELLNIDISALPDGFYIVTVQSTQDILNGRVIKISR